MNGQSNSNGAGRRGFLAKLGGLSGVAAMAASGQTAEAAASSGTLLPVYARPIAGTSLKQSSFDRTGGNGDYWQITAGGMQEVFNADRAGRDYAHLVHHRRAQRRSSEGTGAARLLGRQREAQHRGADRRFLRAEPGLVFNYESAYLACSPGKSLNCYFAMPYRQSARITVTNEGKQEVGRFYSNIDYQTVPDLPADALYFHAQYRQAAPCIPYEEAAKINLDGKNNYVSARRAGAGT